MEYITRYLNHVTSVPHKIKEKKKTRRDKRKKRSKTVDGSYLTQHETDFVEIDKEEMLHRGSYDRNDNFGRKFSSSSSTESEYEVRNSFEINLENSIRRELNDDTELEKQTVNNNNNNNNNYDLTEMEQEEYFYEKFQKIYINYGFKSSEAFTIYKLFNDVCGREDGITLEQFNILFGKLEYYGVRELKDTPFIQRLFYLFDKNNDGLVDEIEFFAGLGIICHGDDEMKLDLTFDLYDLKGNGEVSKEEIIHLFCSTYEHKLRNLANGSTSEAKIQRFVSDCRKVFTCFVDEAFLKLDVNGDGNLSKEEFRVFALNSPKLTAKVNGHKDTVKMTLL